MELVVSYSFTSIILLLRLLLPYSPNLTEKINKTINEIFDISVYILKLSVFLITIINNIDFSDEVIFNDNPNNSISQVLTFNNYDYTINAFLYLYQKEYEFLYHHIITISCIGLCQSYNYHNISLICLFLFNLSSPILSVAKICRMNNYKQLSVISFISFAIVFFTCRILIFSYILYCSIFNEFYDTYRYYFINGTELLIYKLQLHWMYKIIRAIIDNKK